MTGNTLETDRVVHTEDRFVYFAETDTVVWDNKRWFVFGSEGQFHLRLARKWHSGEYSPHAGKAHGELYRPPHPSMTREDIEGATYAYDNGTHWLFAHCSPQEQIDFAIETKTFAMSQFQPLINNAQRKVSGATNTNARVSAGARLSALIEFAGLVGDAVYETIVGETLGYYHRNPHDDHRRDLTVKAINALWALWKKAALNNALTRTKRASILSDVPAIVNSLTKGHTIEWRHEREARLEAEKKKAAEPELS